MTARSLALCFLPSCSSPARHQRIRTVPIISPVRSSSPSRGPRVESRSAYRVRGVVGDAPAGVSRTIHAPSRPLAGHFPRPLPHRDEGLLHDILRVVRRHRAGGDRERPCRPSAEACRSTSVMCRMPKASAALDAPSHPLPPRPERIHRVTRLTARPGRPSPRRCPRQVLAARTPTRRRQVTRRLRAPRRGRSAPRAAARPSEICSMLGDVQRERRRPSGRAPRSAGCSPAACTPPPWARRRCRCRRGPPARRSWRWRREQHLEAVPAHFADEVGHIHLPVLAATHRHYPELEVDARHPHGGGRVTAAAACALPRRARRPRWAPRPRARTRARGGGAVDAGAAVLESAAAPRSASTEARATRRPRSRPRRARRRPPAPSAGRARRQRGGGSRRASRDGSPRSSCMLSCAPGRGAARASRSGRGRARRRSAARSRAHAGPRRRRGPTARRWARSAAPRWSGPPARGSRPRRSPRRTRSSPGALGQRDVGRADRDGVGAGQHHVGSSPSPALQDEGLLAGVGQALDPRACHRHERRRQERRRCAAPSAAPSRRRAWGDVVDERREDGPCRPRPRCATTVTFAARRHGRVGQPRSRGRPPPGSAARGEDREVVGAGRASLERVGEGARRRSRGSAPRRWRTRRRSAPGTACSTDTVGRAPLPWRCAAEGRDGDCGADADRELALHDGLLVVLGAGVRPRISYRRGAPDRLQQIRRKASRACRTRRRRPRRLLWRVGSDDGTASLAWPRDDAVAGTAGSRRSRRRPRAGRSRSAPSTRSGCRSRRR